MSEIEKIARRLIELAKNKQFMEAQKELFSEQVENIEPERFSSRSVKGLDQVLIKEQRFLGNVKEWHRLEISEPLFSTNHFSIQMITEVTFLNEERFLLDEILVYEIENGKIVKERCFY